jgi:plastocyanin
MRLTVALTLAFAITAALLASGCGTPADVNVVEMQNLSFNPGTITIKKGETVRWVNDDQTAHNPTSDDYNSDNPDQSPPTAWSAAPVNPGGAFERTFGDTGIFEYHCMIHDYMKGKVIVEE